MFDIGWSEILLVLVVALIVVGPKDLPRLIRMVGRWVGQARRMADQFRTGFDELTRETELDELRREISALRGNNPVSRFKDEINRSIQRAGTPAASAVTEVPGAESGDVSGVDKHDAPAPVPTESVFAAGSETPHHEPPAAGVTPTGS